MILLELFVAKLRDPKLKQHIFVYCIHLGANRLPYFDCRRYRR
jgi:hypothetical protein